MPDSLPPKIKKAAEKVAEGVQEKHRRPTRQVNLKLDAAYYEAVADLLPRGQSMTDVFNKFLEYLREELIKDRG